MRQGLKSFARKGAGAWPAWRGGDFRSHRKPAGPAFRPPRTKPESPAAAQTPNTLNSLCPLVLNLPAIQFPSKCGCIPLVLLEGGTERVPQGKIGLGTHNIYRSGFLPQRALCRRKGHRGHVVQQSCSSLLCEPLRRPLRPLR